MNNAAASVETARAIGQPRMGLTLMSFGGVSEVAEQAQRAEAAGYDDVWLADTGYPDALTVAALICERTERVRVGIAVVPAYTRTPAVLASSAGTLAEISDGRFVLGIGTSSHTMIENWHGLRLERPLARMRETTELMRTMLAGEKTAYDGEILRSRGYRQSTAAHPVPIHLAALRPKMLELAAEIGDGVVLNLFPQAALPKIMDHIRAGAERRAPGAAAPEISCRFQVLVCEDRQVAYQHLRPFMSAYFATPVYNRYLAWCGYPDAAEAVAAGWAAKDRAATAAAITDELIDTIAIIGSRDECQARLREYATGGIDCGFVTCIAFDADLQQATFDAFTAQAFN